MRRLIASAFQTQNKRNRFVTALGLALTGYFLLHTVTGEHGLIAERHLAGEIAKASATLADLQTRQQALAVETQGLEPGSLDSDRLEEEAYKRLGFATPRDEIILFGAPPENYEITSKNK